MKPVQILIVVIFLLTPLILYSQDSDSNKTIKFSERIPAELSLEVKVKYIGAIGYADCFRATVLNINKGNFSDTSVLITVLAGDTANLNILSDKKEDDILKIYLVFNKSNEKYSTTYITGFVDSDKNSWRIIQIIKK
jgi:hypothetical protein